MNKFLIFVLSFFLILNDVSGFGLFPVGRKRMGSKNQGTTWNSDGFGMSYKYQYSLRWDEETCRTRVGHDIGYVKTQSMNPENSEGFFNPGITTSQGYWYYDIWNGNTCRTTTSDNFTPVIPNLNKAFCKSLGAFDVERVCFTTRKAPSSRRELYQWLAEIDYAVGGRASQDDDNLKKVRAGDENALNAGYKNFNHIKMKKWIIDIGLNDPNNEDVLKKYIAPFPGQNMICARARGLGTSASNEACSQPDKCLALDSLDLIIKCLPVPMGPAPYPFTPFIIGKEVIYSAPVKNTEYLKPEVRIVYFEKNTKKIIEQKNLSEGSNDLMDSRYGFRVDVDDNSICSFVTHINNLQISSPYPIGCQDRGLIPKPNIKSDNPIQSSNKLTRRVSGKISYPWAELAHLRPTSLEELKDIDKLQKDQDVYISENYGNVTIFQGGFNRNPEKRKIDLQYLEKKMCSSGSIADPSKITRVVEYTTIDKDCNEIPSMFKNTNLDLYRCTNGSSDVLREEFVLNKDDCSKINLSYDGGASRKGNQCYDETFVPLTKKCSDILSNIVYEHDDDGQKLCIRNWNAGKKQYIILLRNANSTPQVEKIKIIEANNVLMEIDKDGEIDFTKNPVSFGDFSQDELDYFRKLDENHYWYKSVDKDIRYRYGPKLFKIGENITTYLNAETGQPVFFNSNDELLEADPLEQGLCSDANVVNVSKEEWNYILQIPGYYTNYNDLQFNDDKDLKNIESQLIKVPGILNIKRETVQDISSFDDIKKATLLIPTKFEKKSQGSDGIILGISNDLNNREVRSDVLHKSVKDNFKIGSLNFYPDYFENRKKSKILYVSGKDLTKNISSNDINDNIFNTSSCNLIEFEIWGGGGQSRSTELDWNYINSNSLSSSSSDLEYLNGYLQNRASSGSNGAYAHGRFKIREKSLLKMKVSDSSGKISQVGNDDSDSINLDNDFSSISVTDSFDKNLELIKVPSGNGEYHECFNNSRCNSLSEEKLLKKAIDESQQLIVKDDDSREAFKRNLEGIKSIERVNSFDENLIAIDKYRNITMSSFSGVVSNLFSTLPLSSPVVINRYVDDKNNKDYGYKIEKALVSLTKKKNSTDWKDDGSGNFNEIGTYYYFGQLSTGINWINRSRYFDPKVCESKLEACYQSSRLIKDTDSGSNDTKFIYGGNASGAIGVNSSDYLSFIISNKVKKVDLITDFNLYCPGLGGCYFNNGKLAKDGRFISQPGSAGLIKIKCLKI
jgi:hypothetical protein